ncbi:putative integral membrane protein [Desulfocurvibacter africanus PCS]|uniref:Putative integral membrane protein n=1 Tax=Desulfocurvibacter africanus PCS TaxID=1262666 RepID=M5Q0Z4_DESAF|nr:VanZ family protein [Desulfocurvibacter africanus]EMG36103.1 putative integral membrane protein [Desulfocurvibacter africanus PCS]
MRHVFRIAWLASLAATVWLSLQPQPEFPVEFWNADKVYHLLGYVWLGLLGILSFTTSAAKRRALLFTLAFGVAMEFLQGFVPGRMPSFWDGVANAAGVGLAWSARRFSK